METGLKGTGLNMGSLGYVPSFRPAMASVPWLDASFLKRRFSATAIPGHTKKIRLHKATGTDTLTDIYLGANVNDDFSDIRWTAVDGVTKTPYYIEAMTPGSVADVFVKLPASGAGVYLYHKNPSAVSESNGVATFLFFEHFDGPTLDLTKWVQGPNYTGVGVATFTATGLHLVNPNDPNGVDLQSIASFPANTRLRIRAAIPICFSDGFGYYKYIAGNAKGATIQVYKTYAEVQNADSASNHTSIAFTPGGPGVRVDTAFHTYDIIRDGVAQVRYVMDDGAYEVDNNSYPPTGDMNIIVWIANDTNPSSDQHLNQFIDVDSVMVTDYLNPEPPWAAFGADEDYGTTPPPTTYTVVYATQVGGSISGTQVQTVNSGSNSSSVTAVASQGYTFAGWSDGVTTATRSELNVTHNISVTAIFTQNVGVFTLDYLAGDHGHISGAYHQTVSSGVSGTPVTAIADTGYYFTSWSDGSTANPRTDPGTANISVTANYAANPVGTVTLTYLAGSNGTVSGNKVQNVTIGDSGTAVTAVPDTGYIFLQWSDGKSTASRTDIAGVSNLSVTATFGPHGVMPPASKSYAGVIIGVSAVAAGILATVAIIRGKKRK